MTKARKGIMWSLIAVLTALLVALAVVGVTFARYSSEGEGSGSASVAKWDVAVDSSFETQSEVQTFSPSEGDPADVQSESTETYRSNTSSALHVADIINGGDVEAAVTIEGVGALTYLYRDGSCDCSTDACSLTPCLADGVHSGSCTCTCDFCYGYSQYAETLDSHFAVTLYSSDSLEDEYLIDSENPLSVASGATVNIYAAVTWYSDISGDCYGAAADLFDTWCGHYLKKITFTIHFTAVQTGTSNADTGDEP